MKPLATRAWILAAVAAGLLATIAPRSAQADVCLPLYGLTSPDNFRNASWVFGDIFTVGNESLELCALGAYDADGDGFVTPGGIATGLYDEATGTLLASAQILSTSTLDGLFRYEDVNSVILAAGHTYRVVAVNQDDLYNRDPNYTIDPHFTHNGYAYSQGTTLTFLTNPDFTGPDVVWMPNLKFRVVPEPASLVSATIAMGIGLAGFAARRRSRASRAA